MRWPWSKKDPKETPKAQPPESVWKPQVGDWTMVNRCHCGYTAIKYNGTIITPVICPGCGCDWAGANSKGRWEWEQAVNWEWMRPLMRNKKWAEWTECTHQDKSEAS